MTRFPNSRYKLINVLAALAVTMFVARGAAAAAAPIDEKQLLDVGFKVLVATTKVQQEWVRTLGPARATPPGRRARQLVRSCRAAKSGRGRVPPGHR